MSQSSKTKSKRVQENERRKRRLFSLIIKRNGILLPDEADELRALLRAEGKVLITERIYFNQ